MLLFLKLGDVQKSRGLASPREHSSSRSRSGHEPPQEGVFRCFLGGMRMRQQLPEARGLQGSVSGQWALTSMSSFLDGSFEMVALKGFT